MLSTKWDMDENRGKGHTHDKSRSFSEVLLSGYPRKLEAFVASATHRTNEEIYRFGLENGFLPKHTNEILRGWNKEGLIEVIPLDGGPAKGFYLAYNPNRHIGVRLKKPVV